SSVLKDLPTITIGKQHTKRSYSSKPLYTERYVQWCEGTDREIIPIFLLDYNWQYKDWPNFTYSITDLSAPSLVFARDLD
ncbi:hypothetical protein, partial [Olivibacter jilunii]|uniref:hypothetical protein n=1 Tax=Olivibacter jilunii TaxID=985016 RepID=UPI003F16EB33